jgi:hypothetical protein
VDSGNLSAYGGQGFAGDVRVASGAAENATYVFTGLTLGDVYSVAATWTAYSNRATDAPYSIQGVEQPTIVPINQRLAPNDFQDQGAAWEELGAFVIDSNGILTIRLAGSSTGEVIADAVRVERLTDPEVAVDQNGTNVQSGTTTVDFGAVLRGSSLARKFTVTNVGAGLLNLGAALNLPAGFSLDTYSVSPAALFDGASTTSLAHGQSATFEVLVDTTSLGTQSGTLSFVTNDTDENPFAFTIQANVVGSLIIDNGDNGYRKSAGFTTYGGQGFQGDVDADNPGGGDTATWTFAGLSDGIYRVSAAYSPYYNRATLAPYTINGGPALTVNQRLAASDPLAGPLGTSVSEAGSHFTDLSVTTSPVAGTITVTLTEALVGQVIADAIRIERLGALYGELPLSSESSSPDGPVSDASAVVGTASIPSVLLGELVARATEYWTSVDAEAVALLRDVQVVVSELPEPLLGLGSFTTPTIWLDDDAGGQGWLLTPAAVREGVGAPGRGMDLLTVITHELGHVLGYDDLDSLDHDHDHDIMSGVLAAGQYRGPLSDMAANADWAWPEHGRSFDAGLHLDQLPQRLSGLPLPSRRLADALAASSALVDDYFAEGWGDKPAANGEASDEQTEFLVSTISRGRSRAAAPKTGLVALPDEESHRRAVDEILEDLLGGPEEMKDPRGLLD